MPPASSPRYPHPGFPPMTLAASNPARLPSLTRLAVPSTARPVTKSPASSNSLCLSFYLFAFSFLLTQACSQLTWPAQWHCSTTAPVPQGTPCPQIADRTLAPPHTAHPPLRV